MQCVLSLVPGVYLATDDDDNDNGDDDDDDDNTCLLYTSDAADETSTV